MSELDDLRRENQQLRQDFEQLSRSAAETSQAFDALSHGEADAVAVEQGGPVLLRAAQNELRDNRKLLRAIFDSALDAITLADDDGVYVDANPAACKLFALSRAQLIGRSFADFAPPGVDGPARFRAFRAHGTMVGIFAIHRLDGTTATLELSAVADVVPGRHLSILRDRTERLEIEQALRRSEVVFRAVIEKSSEIISLTRADGTTRYLTPSAWQMLGWSPEEAVSRTMRDQVVLEDRLRIESGLEQMVGRGERDLAMEIRVTHRDGSLRWVEALATNLLDDPNVAAIVGNYRDITARKRSDNALREGRDRLEEAQALAHLGSWAAGMGPDDLIMWSPECYRIFGIAEGEVITKAFFLSRLPPSDRERMELAISQMLTSGHTHDLEHRVVRPDGSMRWVLSRAVVERDQAERPARMRGTIQDITERHDAFAAVQASEQQYRKIIENTSEGVWLYDSSATLTFVNKQLATMLGTTVDDVVGRSVLAFIYDSDHEKVRQGIARRRRGIAERVEVRLRHRDGSPVWTSVQVNPLFEPDGSFEGALVLVTDISTRRAADEARARLAAIVESSDNAIVSIGVDGSIESWNRSAEILYQYAAQEVMGRPVSLLFPLESHHAEHRANTFAIAGHHTDPHDVTHVRRDGSLIEVAVQFSPIAAEGVIIATAMTARDLTASRLADAAHRRTQEQFRQAQKMEAVGRLAGGVAHDFNNLLSVILSYSHFAIEDLKAGDPLRDDMVQIDMAAQRASELTKQLLAFSRRQVLQARVLDVNKVISALERMLKRLVGENIKVTLLTDPTIGRVNADSGQLEQVVMNLVVNAKDAMPEGGSLTIETTSVHFDREYVGGPAAVTPGDYVLIAVSDTGIGMDTATCAQVFEPFFTTKEPGKGTGLGLSTVFGIVRQSGGYISVYSEVGHGTTFKLYLPMTDRPAEAHDASRPAMVLQGSETILVVEDEDQVRTVACAILRRNGYTVLDTSNGGEAFLVSKSFTATIHLLLTDVVMPRMSGRKLAEELVSQRPAMKVLYASGYTDDTIIHHGVLESGVAFLQKPFTPDALLRKVREVLDATPTRG